MSRIRPLALLLLPLGLVLSACTVTSTPSVTADYLEETAATSLGEQNDLTGHSIDCGQDRIQVVEGAVVDCVLTNAAGTQFETEITLVDVQPDGTFRINVQVADAPIGGGSEPETPAPSDGETLTVPSATLAELAKEALFDELGYTPSITCAPTDVPLAVGETIECDAILQGEGNDDLTATIEITSVEGTDYAINARIS